MNDFVKQGNRFGIFLLIWFAICFAWYFVRPVDPILYFQFFRMSFFRFYGMDWMSFISGAIQTYIWGYFVVGTWIAASKLSGFNK